MAGACTLLATQAALAFLLCQPPVTAAEMARAGEVACRAIQRDGACNAWFWDDPRYAARKAPMSDSQAALAIATWVNKTGALQIHRPPRP